MNSSFVKLSPNYKVKIWEDRCVAYHLYTGSVHLLDGLSAQVIVALKQDSEKGIFVNDLIIAVRNIEQNQYADDIIETYIRQLAIAGILERCSTK